jgi:hypothetical protein
MTVHHENQVPWPQGRGVTTDRKSGPFQVSMASACERIYEQLEFFNKAARSNRCKSLTIYANWPIGAKGFFLNNGSSQDPRVVVVFDLDGLTYSVAADRYSHPAQNIAGIANYIEAIRAQERNGVVSVAEMFSPFAALPTRSDCWAILGVAPTISRAELDQSYRALVRENHPDVGGDPARMAEINAAYDKAQKVLA